MSSWSVVYMDELKPGMVITSPRPNAPHFLVLSAPEPDPDRDGYIKVWLENRGTHVRSVRSGPGWVPATLVGTDTEGLPE